MADPLVCTFLGSGLTPHHYYFSENGDAGMPEKAFVFVELQVSLSAYS